MNNFKSIEFNDGLKKIESGAFAGSSIEKITLPESIEVIEIDAFTENNVDIVYGYENSYAEEWSSDQGVDFKYLKHENNIDQEVEEFNEQPFESKDEKMDKEETNKINGKKINSVKNDFDFEEIEGKDGIIITGYSGTKKDIIFPNKINNKNVTKIGDEAF